MKILLRLQSTRDHLNYKSENLHTIINDVEWNRGILSIADLEKAYDNFIKIANVTFPTRLLRLTNINQLIKAALKIKYLEQRNLVSALIKKSKEKYSEKLLSNQRDFREMCSIVMRLVGGKQSPVKIF